ncbi:hypothetical protein SEA_LIZZ_81 [Streptomyces phage Lizz]|nr:hypothetical protein SEA_PHTOWN_81 [Streptomyces phage PHTowN]QNO12898.1 hypothetical protein SEA_SHAKENBAKE_81 [Streptomyces phage ShakeNBake]QYW07628.1 hypothetical protein SEA_LIZZ_81 [Streptomyces phage Lizz]
MRTRRVLLIGGLMDGKWHTHLSTDSRVYIAKPMQVTVLREEDRRALACLPEHEVYHLQHVALYGHGLWVGLHESTLDRLSMERPGPTEAHTGMILRAILQRDVATELGL